MVCFSNKILNFENLAVKPPHTSLNEVDKISDWLRFLQEMRTSYTHLGHIFI